MEIKYYYSIPLTEGTSTLSYEEFLDYVGSEEDFNAEDVKEAIRDIAIEDLENAYGSPSPEFDITISDEYVNELVARLNAERTSQSDAVESIKKILDNFDYETQQRILNMV